MPQANGLQLRDAVLLGTIQGLAEFLPVSSSAHLALARRLLGVEHPRALDIALHLGSTAALLVVMRGDLRAVMRCRSRSAAVRPAVTAPFLPATTLLVATLPAVVAGSRLDGRLGSFERQPVRMATAVLAGTAALVAAARAALRGRGCPPADRPHPQPVTAAAFVAGFAQAVALIPGVSRSGATIAAGVVAGLDCAASARLSFLLAVPITLAANVRAAGEVRALLRDSGPRPLLAGGAAAAVAGLAGASLLHRWLSPRGLFAFAAYRCALAAALLLLPPRVPRVTPPSRTRPSGR